MNQELFGLPGAGKSYQSKKIAKLKNVQCVMIKNRTEKFLYSALFILLHFRIFLFFTKKIYSENKFNKKLFLYKFKYIFFNAMARIQKARARNQLIDEGFFQFILGLYERKIDSKELEPLFGILKRFDFFVYIVEADKSIREERMKARGRVPRSKFFGEEYASRMFKVLEYNYKIVKQFIVDNFDSEIIINK